MKELYNCSCKPSQRCPLRSHKAEREGTKNRCSRCLFHTHEVPAQRVATALLELSRSCIPKGLTLEIRNSPIAALRELYCVITQSHFAALPALLVGGNFRNVTQRTHYARRLRLLPPKDILDDHTKPNWDGMNTVWCGRWPSQIRNVMKKTEKMKKKMTTLFIRGYVRWVAG